MPDKSTILPEPGVEEITIQPNIRKPKIPFVSILTPAFNEAAIIENHLHKLCAYMQGLEQEYGWEIIVIDDGSTDETGVLAERIAQQNPKVKVFHHRVNSNLGKALQTGFREATGEYIVVMDIDLTYSEDHIARLLSKLQETDADIVIASPYMKGGKNTAVPVFRLVLSKVVNRIMRIMAPGRINTFTGMVRAYKKDFLKNLNLKSSTYAINPEIIFKSFILRARVIEIPAHLDWSFQKRIGKKRSSSIRIFNGITGGLMSGFIFRPYVFFMSIGLVLLLISVYIIAWIFIQTFNILPEIPLVLGNFEDRFGLAVATVFKERPYSFMVGGITLITSLQFLSTGFLSLQNKRYFDELFHINTTLLKNQNKFNPKESNNNQKETGPDVYQSF
ncbi:MAG: glycosyltransferase family 2 protein [Saprospiraceae bacterium]|nr:glycosyltransferase family 2 protein [Saprospiraceae bacterium]MCB9322266.1 glycosyltransferase family 2 protein [Lewinellaceae bacterium]